MKKLVMSLVCALCVSPAFGQSQDCVAIKQDKQRLACFDKAATAPKERQPAPVVVPVATVEKSEKQDKPGDKEVFKSHSWHVHQELDAMTDKKSCVALYKNAWTIQGTSDNFYVSLRGRGGVKAYTLRVDDAAPDSMQLASSTEKSLSAIILKPSFDRIYNGKRVRLQIGTILDSFLVEDIDLDGLKDAVDYIRANCAS